MQYKWTFHETWLHSWNISNPKNPFGMLLYRLQTANIFSYYYIEIRRVSLNILVFYIFIAFGFTAQRYEKIKAMGVAATWAVWLLLNRFYIPCNPMDQTNKWIFIHWNGAQFHAPLLLWKLIWTFGMGNGHGQWYDKPWMASIHQIYFHEISWKVSKNWEKIAYHHQPVLKYRLHRWWKTKSPANGSFWQGSCEKAPLQEAFSLVVHLGLTS